jgi:hypothetical protein
MKKIKAICMLENGFYNIMNEYIKRSSVSQCHLVKADLIQALAYKDRCLRFFKPCLSFL